MIKNIDTTPSESYFNAHYFCDYIELLALVNNEDIVSSEDVFDKFYDDEKFGTTGSQENSQHRDEWESRINDWFSLLDVRENVFGFFYPFMIHNHTIKLKKNLDKKHKIYLFLLLNSTQSYIKSNKNLLTSDFEELSCIALKHYLASTAQVFRFGKSMLDTERYKGHIKNKIDLLAQDLNYKIKYREHYFALINSGDGGLDIVAWNAFEDDNRGNIQICLGQCATGKNWRSKQDDTKKFEDKYIEFESNVSYSMFIPYDSRNIDRSFNEEASMGKYLFFDRIRLINLVGEDRELLSSRLSSFVEVVDKVIEFEEDII